jgi:hypothetical protein
MLSANILGDRPPRFDRDNAEALIFEGFAQRAVTLRLRRILTGNNIISTF